MNENGHDVFSWYETHKWAVLGLMPRIYSGRPLVRASEIGTARLQLDKLHSVVQMTEHISQNKPFRLLITGERKGKAAQYMLEVGTDSIITVTPVKEGAMGLTDDLTAHQIVNAGENQVLVHKDGALKLYKYTT